MTLNERIRANHTRPSAASQERSCLMHISMYLRHLLRCHAGICAFRSHDTCSKCSGRQTTQLRPQDACSRASAELVSAENSHSNSKRFESAQRSTFVGLYSVRSLCCPGFHANSLAARALHMSCMWSWTARRSAACNQNAMLCLYANFSGFELANWKLRLRSLLTQAIDYSKSP
jgi:hypothetical protein